MTALNGATVTMSLNDLDYLRARSDELRTLQNGLKECLVMANGLNYTWATRSETVFDIEMTKELKKYIFNLFEEDFRFDDKLVTELERN